MEKEKMKKYLIFMFLLLFPFGLYAKSEEVKICNGGAIGYDKNYLYSAITSEESLQTGIWQGTLITLYDFYVNETKDSAYCIHPGKKAANPGHCKDNYYLRDDAFLTDGCEKTTDSGDCGLAGILAYANSEENKGKYDYVEILTALRLWNVIYGEEKGEGWWVAGETNPQKYKIYTTTANYLLANPSFKGHGFWKLNKDVVPDVLFEHEQPAAEYDPNYQQVDDAFGLFRWAAAGNLIYTPQVEVNDDENISFDKTGKAKITIITTFSPQTEIISVSISDPVKVDSVSNGYACESDKFCYDINISIGLDELKTCDSLDLELEIKYNDPNDKLSQIKKYETNNDEYQTFIVYNESAKEGVKTLPVTVFCEYCDSATSCCPGDTYETNKNCGKCTDLTISYNIPKNCPNTSSDNVEGTIEDPKLCTLLNSANSKSKYKLEDITYTYNGSMNNLCSVYCREKFIFRFMDKEEAIAGRTFKYSVTGNQLTTINKYLTVVIATRECSTNEIKYEKWKSQFNELNSKILDAWNNYKKYEAMSNNEKLHQASGSCSCYSVDCYSRVCVGPEPDDCDLVYTHSTGTPSGSDYWTWYSWDNAWYNHTYSNGSTNNINVSGQSGSDRIKSHTCPSCSDESFTCEGDEGKSIKSEMDKWKSTYDGYINVRKKMIDALNNCSFKLESGVIKDILDYEFTSNVSYEYEDFYTDMISIEKENLNNVKTPTIKYCSGEYCSYDNVCPTCDSEINESINNSLEIETLLYWECSGEETNARCTNINIDVPKSKMAYISTETEEAYYQQNEFYTQILTGTVSTEKLSNSIIVEDESGQTEYLFPLELAKTDGLYETTLKFENINKDFRNQMGIVKIKNIEYTCDIEIINETVLCEGACSGSGSDVIDPGSSLGFIFRPIDLENVFPNVRIRGRNWATSQNVIDAIQNLGKNIWNEKTQYSVTLTAAQIRKIKEYNSKTVYNDYSIDCKNESGQIDPSNCKSLFLRNYLSQYNNAEKYSRLPSLSNQSTDDLGNYYLWQRKVFD